MTSIDKLQKGQTVKLTITPTVEDVERVMELSKDRNRIHWDPDFAKKKGLRGCVVQGGLLSQYFAGIIVSEIGDGTVVTSVNLKFRGFVFLGETIKLQATVKNIRPDLGFVSFECLCFVKGREDEDPAVKCDIMATVLADTTV